MTVGGLLYHKPAPIIEQVVKARDAFRAQAVSTKDKNER